MSLRLRPAVPLARTLLAAACCMAPMAMAQTAAPRGSPSPAAATEPAPAEAIAAPEIPPLPSAPPVAPPSAAAAPAVADAAVPPESPAAPAATEDDFEAIYGNAARPDAAGSGVLDPWERINRRVHRFNNVVDRRVASPLARTYLQVVPRPVRTGVSNFFSNLAQPTSAVNALLQGKPRQAAHSLGRFVVNSTLGIGGVFDPATDARLDNRNEDFGQTLGVWGWKRSRYVELPLLGPRTVRDIVGLAGDAPLAPLRQVESQAARAPLQVLQLVDMRMQLMSTDAMREGVIDDYALVRDAWSQRRDYQISGDSGSDSLPAYLRDAPAAVEPTPPPGG